MRDTLQTKYWGFCAAKSAGYVLKVPFRPGRMDASPEQTEATSFAVLEPKADGFRNYYCAGNYLPPPEGLVEGANMLTLTVPEMMVLVCGMRVLNANAEGSQHGVFTKRPGILSNDLFVNLLDMGTNRQSRRSAEGIYEGLARPARSNGRQHRST
jgi:catalase-peroxidase